MTLVHKIKKLAWFFILPVHPLIRDLLLKLKLIKHYGRQPYHLGWLRPDKTLKEFKAFLLSKGFRYPFPTWIDNGEVIDLRLLESFDFQYHIRVFEDGEVRGHYEITVESHPIHHIRDTYTEPQREKFLEFIKDWIVQERPGAEPGNTTSHNAPAASRG